MDGGEPWDLYQFLTKYVNLDLEDEDIFDEFIKIINSNIGAIARMTNSDALKSFDNFTSTEKSLIRSSLAESVLEFFDLKDQFKQKKRNKSNEESIIEDILTYSKLLLAMPDQMKSYDFSKLFSKQTQQYNSQKVRNKILEDNFSTLLKEVTNLKEIIINQNKIIEKINNENKIIKDELIKINNSLDLRKQQTQITKSTLTPINTNMPPNAFQVPPQPLSSTQQPQPTLFSAFQANQSSFSNHLPQTPTSQSFTFSKVIQQNTQPQTGSPVNRSIKRPLTNQNNSSNKSANSTKQTLKNFNSFDPNSQNTEMDLPTNDGFKLAERRKPRNKSNSYLKTIGLDESNMLSTQSKPFYIYLGRIGMTESEKTVGEFLKIKLNNIKIGSVEKKVEFKDLKELNSDNNDRTYKSFVFSVGFLDKEIVNNKALWPLYSVVNKYKLPKAEWLKLAEKFKNKNQTANLTTSND